MWVFYEEIVSYLKLGFYSPYKAVAHSILTIKVSIRIKLYTLYFIFPFKLAYQLLSLKNGSIHSAYNYPNTVKGIPKNIISLCVT